MVIGVWDVGSWEAVVAANVRFVGVWGGRARAAMPEALPAVKKAVWLRES